MTIDIHPAAAIFPMIDEASYIKLRDDIAENGVREDIAIYDGQVVDGRNRLRALQELGLDHERHCCELSEDVDPFAYAISVNLHRRQLSTKQRAIVGARMATLGHGGDRKGDEFNGQNCLLIDEAAGLLGVSARSIKNAKHVLAEGHPKLIELVEQDRVSVSLASKFIREVPEQKEQAKIVKLGVEGIKQAVPSAVSKAATPPKSRSMIDSGPLEQTDRFEDIPTEKWRQLLTVKRMSLETHMTYECRCLLESVKEAETAWKGLGYESAEEMIRSGYRLDPVQIELAEAWLKHIDTKPR